MLVILGLGLFVKFLVLCKFNTVLFGVFMSVFEILSPLEHRDMKISTEVGESFGDNVQYATTYSLEFRSIQGHYPIFFSKNEKDEFSPVALFGFEKNENLFLNKNTWDASYIPMMVQRQPFSIGLQVSEDGQEKPIVSIEKNSPRISNEKGQRIFDQEGNPTEYLTRIMSKLEALHHGHEHNKVFVEALVENELLEPFTLKVPLKNNSNNELIGFYTINEEKLLDLDGAVLKSLNANGYLQPIYMALASYSRINVLIEKKNKKIQNEWDEKLNS